MGQVYGSGGSHAYPAGRIAASCFRRPTMSYSTDDIRNIALAGQASAGKTTLFEALLHAGGAIQTAGTIERGTTVSDHDPLEKERRHSLGTAIASIDFAGAHINLVDTP